MACAASETSFCGLRSKLRLRRAEALQDSCNLWKQAHAMGTMQCCDWHFA